MSNPDARRLQWVYVLLVMTALGLAVGSASLKGWLEGPELRALDLAFVYRWRAHGSEPVDPRVRLVTLDDISLQKIRKPLIFWHQEFAEVLEALNQARAAAVAFDMILNPARDDFPRDDPISERLDQGEQVLGKAILDGPVVLMEYLDAEGLPPTRSAPALHFMAEARGNAAAANVVTDSDGTVRRAPLLWVEPEPGQPGQPRAAFARLAELASGRPLVAGSLVSEDAGVRINYAGPPGLYPSVPFSFLLRRVRAGDPLEEYRDSVVLLGATAPSLQDTVDTPYNLWAAGEAYSKMPGVEALANAVNTVLTGRFIRRAGPGAWLGSILGLTLLVGALAFGQRRPRGSVAAVVLYLLAALEVFSRSGLWLPMAAPIAAATLAWGTGYLLRYLMVDRERRWVRSVLGRYVSPQVMQELLRHPDSLRMGGSRRPVTVLFSDINGFSGFCSRRSPEEVITMLNRYFEEMVAIIFGRGGTVKQFVGDEIMALFGVPEAQPDHAARAVGAALDMVARLESLERAGGEGFYRVKIGIHTGQAVVGNVGSLERSEFAAVGDDVNVAARIEARAGALGATLLVSQETRREAEPHLPGVEWIDRGAQELKGIGREITVYEVRRQGG